MRPLGPIRLRVWIGFVALPALVSAASAGASDARYEAAGVIAYSRIQGQTYLLLADHKDSDRGWGSFGGWREEGETPADAAWREFREETRCAYESLSPRELEGKPSVDQENFLTYVVEVPFVPAQVFEKRSTQACSGPAFDERGPWIWIPLEELVATLANPDSTGEYELPADFVAEQWRTRLWSKSATVIQKAIDAGLLE